MFTTDNQTLPTRRYFTSGSLQLSYLDFGGVNQPILLLLHGHMGNARTFSAVATRFPDWHVIALDQRGHGWSSHSPEKDYSRNGYISDIHHLISHELDGRPVTLLGHSLGGVNAYQFAARYPELVQAVIVEDIGVEIQSDLNFAAMLPKRSNSLLELREALVQAGLRAVDYFSESVFEDEDGWGFRADLEGMNQSQACINGSWWEDWLTSVCPILLIHGQKSFALDLDQAKRMATRRPNTKLEVFAECGHGVHSDDPEGFVQVVKKFLEEL
ncbi:alpha/beta fold hydrolase [Paenibacillus sp. HJL G12]|uniref:Alpha/beta fold hydrolase n=1 Tax=Paenibacillus dendrobii TaxID=2691084 RepID=A0A7X3IIR9_9BACL|nr:alpha/beta hydrolase [Paenibacillus dendrobii]MWV43335.1 alpha/beta fold hydrolase [Paenibacillus dendrobii]